MRQQKTEAEIKHQTERQKIVLFLQATNAKKIFVLEVEMFPVTG